ncbi:MAG: hypothetical protein IKB16_05475 [Lentisphaeria bacterium]|nr:hypothetical protein [Lentisphaeria bacterium]
MSIQSKILTTAVFLFSLVCVHGEILIKNGDKVAFLGDSITNFGNRPDGYVRLVMDGLKRCGVNATAIPAGISGNKSNDMLKRVDAHVIRKGATVMLLSCGVNDVGHGTRGVKLPDYKKNITAILDKAQAAGIRVVILTPTLCREHDLKHEYNEKLKAYCAFLHEIAAQRNIPVADLYTAMYKEVAALKHIKGYKLTIDNLHMNGYGNQMMAEGVLKTLGVPAEKIQEFKKDWNKIPSMAPIVNNQHFPRRLISIEDYEWLRKKAQEKGISAEELAWTILKDGIKALKK